MESAREVSDASLGAHLDDAGATVVLAKDAARVRARTPLAVAPLRGDLALEVTSVAAIEGRCVALVEPRGDGWWVVVTAGTRPLAPPVPSPAPPPPRHRRAPRPYHGPGGSIGLGAGFPSALGAAAAVDLGPALVEVDAGLAPALVLVAVSTSVRAGVRLPVGRDGHGLVVGGRRAVDVYSVFPPGETERLRAAELAVGYDHAVARFSGGQALMRLELGGDVWLAERLTVTPLVAMGLRLRLGGQR